MKAISKEEKEEKNSGHNSPSSFDWEPWGKEVMHCHDTFIDQKFLTKPELYSQQIWMVKEMIVKFTFQHPLV